MADKYLLHPLETYRHYDTPCDKALVKDYEDALEARSGGAAATMDPKFKEQYASKVGALIYVVPVSRVDCAYTIGVLARCLTFPTSAMSAAADRCLAYLAQHPDDGIIYDSKSSIDLDLRAYSCLLYTSPSPRDA